MVQPIKPSHFLPRSGNNWGICFSTGGFSGRTLNASASSGLLRHSDMIMYDQQTKKLVAAGVGEGIRR